jgi:hypothetical protein
MSMTEDMNTDNIIRFDASATAIGQVTQVHAATETAVKKKQNKKGGAKKRKEPDTAPITEGKLIQSLFSS